MFNTIWNKSLHWTKDRAWEIEVYRDLQKLLGVEIDLSLTGSDHAGPIIDLCLIGFGLRMTWPHRCHWDYKNDCWQRNQDAKIPPKL